MGAALPIQKAIYETLRADATMHSLLAEDVYNPSPSEPAVYDDVPPQVQDSENDDHFPYICIGDDTSIPFDTDDVAGEETTVTLHIWDRYRGQKRVKQIRDAVKDLLHDCRLPVVGQNAIFCFFDFSSSVQDPEPMTQHHVIRFRIATQQA